jgi:hypothetical protein
MARIAQIDALYSLKTSGKFGYSGGFGMLRLGKARYSFYHKLCGIYHTQTSSTGKFQAIVNFYTPTNPRTPAQQAQRAKYGAAVGAYRALTDAQKKAYSKAGSTRGLRGYEYFVQKYLRSH